MVPARGFGLILLFTPHWDYDGVHEDIEYVERRNFFSLIIIAIVVAYIANLMRVVTRYIVGLLLMAKT